jgi:hypothetical protein
LADDTPASPFKSQPPTTGAALIARARVKNRVLALAVVAFMAAVFALTIVVTVGNRYDTSAVHRAGATLAAQRQPAAR